MKTTITKINEVKSYEVLVSLSGMRRDLTDCMSITPSDIKQWFCIDENGETKQCSIKVGQAIEFDLPSQATRRLKNVVFI